MTWSMSMKQSSNLLAGSVSSSVCEDESRALSGKEEIDELDDHESISLGSAERLLGSETSFAPK